VGDRHGADAGRALAGVGLDLPVSVNIGARQLQQRDFVDRLRALLAAHPGVKPGRLELEVLETSALEDMAQVSQVIEDCAQIGVNVCAGRLWHRLLVADLPQAPARHAAQNRPEFCARHARRPR
jgi:hypothetical protein